MLEEKTTKREESRPKSEEYQTARKLILDTESRDVERGLQLLEEAANAGNDDASLLLGELFQVASRNLDFLPQAIPNRFCVQSGNHVPFNLTKAIEYFNYSTSLGNPSAQYALAFVYETGKGLPTNKPLVMSEPQTIVCSNATNQRLLLMPSLPQEAETSKRN